MPEVNSNDRYQCARGVERHPVRSVGRPDPELHRVRDKEEISMISTELATKASPYRVRINTGRGRQANSARLLALDKEAG